MPPITGTQLELGGETYTLRYTTGCLVKLDRQRSEPITETLESLGKGSLAALVDVLWAGLLSNSPAPSIDEVAEMVTPESMEAIGEAIAEALENWSS